MDKKKAWKDKASTVNGLFGVLFLYLVLIGVVIVSIIPHDCIRAFFVQNTYLLTIVSAVIVLITIAILVWFFEGRTKLQLYNFIKPTIEAYAFMGSAYYLNITKANEPIVFVIISLILLGTIKVIDAILALSDYLFKKTDSGSKEN